MPSKKRDESRFGSIQVQVAEWETFHKHIHTYSWRSPKHVGVTYLFVTDMLTATFWNVVRYEKVNVTTGISTFRKYVKSIYFFRKWRYVSIFGSTTIWNVDVTERLANKKS